MLIGIGDIAQDGSVRLGKPGRDATELGDLLGKSGGWSCLILEKDVAGWFTMKYGYKYGYIY